MYTVCQMWCMHLVIMLTLSFMLLADAFTQSYLHFVKYQIYRASLP